MRTNPYPHPVDFVLDHQDATDLGSDEMMAQKALYWTEIDGDLTDVDPTLAKAMRDQRLAIAKFDNSRTSHWHDPEHIATFTDIPYLPDGGYDRANGEVRGHLLDLYLPIESIERGGQTTPVFIDIHGGGFSYGYKELNRNFCTHLAAQGFAVFNLNYRPAPETNLAGQLDDIQAALRWIERHASNYPISTHNVFLTGDSAGGALAWLTMLITNATHAHNNAAADAFGITNPASLPIAGAALVSGVYDLADGSSANSAANGSTRSRLEHDLGSEFFAGLEQAQPWLDPEQAVTLDGVAPVYLLTSSDDFIQAETLHLATALAEHGRDVELDDVYVPATETLGHVFSICLTWLPESQQALRQIRQFALRNCR